MIDYLKKTLEDESGAPSSARLLSAVVIIAGILIAVVGLVLVAVVAKESATTISTYALGALGVMLGSGSANIWAAQTKSAKVLAAQTTAPPPSMSAMATTAIALAMNARRSAI